MQRIRGPCLRSRSDGAAGWIRGEALVRIAVVGVGGVGGYFGGRLARAGEEVHLIARGEHLEAIRRDGIRVRSVAGDFEVRAPATDDPAEIGPVDHVLFCVKSYDTEAVAPSLGPMLHDSTGVVSLQNGVDNEDILARHVGEQHVLGGVAFILSVIAEPGVVAQTGGPRRILVGEMDGSRSTRVEELVAACRAAQIDAEARTDIRVALWDKLAFICAQAGMTAAVRLPIGELREVPEAMEMFRRIVEEVRTVAAAEDVELEEGAMDRHDAFARSLEPGSFSSLHDDLVRGSRMELDALHGSVVRRAAAHGVPVPMCEGIYAILRPWAVHNEGPSD
jgi:2-dehydropantoate 2-reductase